MPKRNILVLASVILMVLMVFAFKFTNTPALRDLHARNQDYKAEINLAIKNHQPIFIEFYGDY